MCVVVHDAALYETLLLRRGSLSLLCWCLAGNIRYFVLLFGRYVTYAWQGASINGLCLFIKLLLTHVVQEYGNELDYVGRHEEALVAIDRAIAIDPNTSVRYHFRAWTLTGMLTCIS